MSSKKICFNCKYSRVLANGWFWCEMCDCNIYTTDSCGLFKSIDEEGEQ